MVTQPGLQREIAQEAGAPITVARLSYSFTPIPAFPTRQQTHIV